MRRLQQRYEWTLLQPVTAYNSRWFQTYAKMVADDEVRVAALRRDALASEQAVRSRGAVRERAMA